MNQTFTKLTGLLSLPPSTNRVDPTDLIALIFIIFDVEVVFMFPWAVVFQELGLLAFVEMFIFLAILLVGFAYVWVKGDLDWVKMKLKYAAGRYANLGTEESN